MEQEELCCFNKELRNKIKSKKEKKHSFHPTEEGSQISHEHKPM